MTATVRALNRIEAGLERLGLRAVLESFQPGIAPEKARKLFEAVGLHADGQLTGLYSWHDGSRTSGHALGEVWIFPGFYLPSIEEAVANYRAFVADLRWNPRWFPIFANGGGDFYLVDLCASARPMRHFRIEETEQPVEFNSLCDMLETLASAFERGVFFIDSDGYLEMDDASFASVAAELNPQISWWRN